MPPRPTDNHSCRRLPDGTAIYVVGERDPAIRLDLFLKEKIPKMSRRRIQDAIGVRVEAPGHGRPRPATILRPGDEVIVHPLPAPIEDEPDLEIPILHVDEELLVIDKPAGLLVHPSNHTRKGSVTHVLSRQIGGPIHLVHRLDRETSGVLIVARSSAAARFLAGQISREREGIEKRYLAVVFGEVKIQEGVIDLPIGPAVRSAVFVKRGVNEMGGRASRTDFTVLARGGGFSLVAATLHTGRRHQIRVHLAAIGHAVVGDKLYGPAESHYLRFIRGGFDERMRRELMTERQLLHSERMSFRHPRTDSVMTFTAELPPDMRQFLDAAGIPVRQPTCGRAAKV